MIPEDICTIPQVESWNSEDGGLWDWNSKAGRGVYARNAGSVEELVLLHSLSSFDKIKLT